MSRIAIVNALVDNVGLSKKHANAVLKELFDASEGVIAKALKKGEKVASLASARSASASAMRVSAAIRRPARR